MGCLISRPPLRPGWAFADHPDRVFWYQRAPIRGHDQEAAEKRHDLAPQIDALPSTVKQLIAVAAAHVTQCPYCIRGHIRAAARIVFGSHSKSFERSVDPYGCFGNAHAHRRVMRGRVPAETASKKSHRYPDGSSLSLPSRGSWITSRPFYATSALLLRGFVSGTRGGWQLQHGRALTFA